MNFKKMREEVGFAFEGVECPRKSQRVAIHKEHGAGHESRQTQQVRMSVLIESEVAGLECSGESLCLAKAEREPSPVMAID